MIALAGCDGQQAPDEQTGPEHVPVPPPASEEELPPLEIDCWLLEGIERDECLADEALQKGEVMGCYLIQNQEVKEQCIYPFALSRPELCRDLSGELRDDCYLNSANLTHDEAECEKIDDEGKQEICRGMFKAPCEDVDDVGYNRSLCEALYYKDARKCDANETFADVCRFDLSLALNASGACDDIGAESLRLACFAITTDQPQYCDGAAVQEVKDLCYVITARELENEGLCEHVELGSVGQYIYSTQGTLSYLVQCYAEVAIRRENYTVCEGLESTIDQDDCYDAVARALLLPEACSHIYKKVSSSGNPVITSKHDSCYREVAKLMSDPSVCNYIIAIPTRDRYCYLSIIYGRTDSGEYAYNYTLEQCMNIADEVRKWSCVSELAKRNSDVGLCELIPEGSTKNTCIAQAQP